MAGAQPSLDQIRLLLSAIFIFLGATVFFIASLISGRNVFRDMSHQLALFISTIVGSLLFAFSPISFLVFAPQLFSISPTGGGWSQIHEQIGARLFWPFMLSAAGLGTVFGALSAVSARTLFLRWLRDSIRLRFPILSYEKSWDNFFFSLKRGASIRIGLKGQDAPCTGELQGFSIRDESKAVLIKSEHDNMYRLIDGADVAYVEAASEAFNRHRDSVSHQAQAFYLAIAVVGLMCMACNAVLVSSYVVQFQFPHLARLYDWLSLVLVSLAVYFAVIAFLSSRQDFLGLRSYLVLCPVVPTVLMVATSAAIFLLWFDLARLWPERVASGRAFHILSMAGGLAVIMFMLFRRYKSRQVDDLIRRVAGASPAQRALLREGCQRIYADMDFNQTKPRQWKDIFDDGDHAGSAQMQEMRRLLLRLGKELHHFTQHATFLGGGPAHYLKGEDFNIVLRLLCKLDKERGRTATARLVL